jgi:hypothetical protein
MNPERSLQHEHGEGADSHAPQTGITANDSTHRAEQDTRNPLWTVVMGMGVLFGIMGTIVALAS